MAISQNKRDFTKWFPFCLLIIVSIICLAPLLGLTHVCFLNPFEHYLIGNFATNVHDDFLGRLTLFGSGLAVLVGIFYLIVFTFVSLGQKLGELFREQEPLKAYCINIGASILGVLLFSFVSFLALPPPIWLLIGIGLCLFSFHARSQIIVLLVTVIAAFMLSNGDVKWSPYYRISLQKCVIPADGIKPAFDYGYNICVNYDAIEGAYNNKPQLLSLLSPKQLKATADYYDTPYWALGDKPRNILVLASGTGNDVAAALRHGALEVDAVEIDPLIGKLGEQIHPEAPYSNPHVHLIINDARAYMRTTKKKYDLVVFAYLDSHTAFSSMSSLRLDNYVYTKESFADAKRLLKPGGAISVTFYYLNWWQLAHVYNALEAGTGEQPIGVYSPQGNGPTLLIGASLDQTKLHNHELKPFSIADLGKEQNFSTEEWSKIITPTDDWPYLFLRDRNGSWTYGIGILFTLFLGYQLIKISFKNFSSEPSAATMFFLGAAFMLIETKSITQMGLVMGTTWLVNSAVIVAILVLIFIANALQIKYKFKNIRLLFSLLVLSLLLNYFLPLQVFNELPVVTRIIASAFFLSMPLFFAAMIFAITFSQVKRADLALGINLFGALTGGVLEYLSMIFGLNALNLIAVILYLLAYFYTDRVIRQ